VQRAFYAGLACLALFEGLKLYLIMPMPGTHNSASLEVGYFLENHEWLFRLGFLLVASAGAVAAFRVRRKWLPAAAALAMAGVTWMVNFHAAAEYVFEEPEHLGFSRRGESRLGDETLVVGVVHNGQAKAYPLRYLTYHHTVRDTVGGKPIMVTYCNLCRTVRVFEPVVGGQEDDFRLVGANRSNSVYEDADTQSWWMQATGTAVAGPLEGVTLPRVEAAEMTARKWFELHPDAVVMQPEEESADHYRAARETVTSEAWQDQSWVVGVELAGATKAYDWGRLKEERVINDELGDTPIVVALAADGQSFAVFERPSRAQRFSLQADDMLVSGRNTWNFSGSDRVASGKRLAGVKSSRESWQCWREFHPDTQR
jgi:hypothetical protein